MFKNHNKKIYVAIIWLIITTILLCIPGKNLPHKTWFSIYQIDKLVHILIFFILSYLFCNIKNEFIWKIFVVMLCCIYGGLMEIVQEKFVSNRSFDFFDILANAVGSCAVIILALRTDKK